MRRVRTKGAIPSPNFSIFVSRRLASVQMPLILTIRPAEANLTFMRFAICNCRSPIAFMLMEIIGMDHHLPTYPGCLFQRHTRVLDVSTVYVSIGAVRQRNPHDGRNRLDNVTNLLLGPLLCFNIEIDPNPTQHFPVRGSHGFSSTQEPSIASFNMTNSKGHLARVAGAKTGRPNSACFFAILWVQEGDVAIPLSAEVDSEAKWMVPRQSEVIGAS